MAKIDKLKQNFEILKILLGALLVIDGFLGSYLFYSKHTNVAFDFTVSGVLILCLYLTIIIVKMMFDNSNEQEIL